MASEDLKWAAALIDKISGPAGRMTKSMKGFEGGMQRADRVLQNLAGGKVAAFGDKVIGGIGKGAAFAGRALLGMGVSAAAGFAAAGVALGAFMVHDTIDAENFSLALGTILGDSKKLEAATSDIDALANLWGIDPGIIEDQMLSLTSKGHDVADALKIIQGAGDLKVLKKDAQGLIDAFTMLDDKGKLSAKAVEKLLGAGLDPKKFREALGGAIGSNDNGDLQEDIENAIKNGTLDAGKLQAVALQTITGMTGKALGGLAEKQSHTLGGLLTTLKSVPDRLMGAVDPSGAIEPMKKALESLNTALNPNSASGQKFAAAITKVSAAIGRVIDHITGDGANVGDWIDTLASGFEIAADVIDAVSEIVSGFVDEFLTGFDAILGPMDEFGGGAWDMHDVVKALAATFKFLGAVVGVTAGLVIQLASWVVEGVSWLITAYKDAANATSRFLKSVVGGISDAFTWLGEGVGSLIDFLGEVWEDFKGFGKAIVDGIWEGITGAWGSLKDGWNKLIDTLPASVADKLKIHSPSRVMMELGGFAAEGFALGVNDGAGDAQSAMTALAAPPALSGIGGGFGRGSAPLIGQLVVQVDGSSGDGRAIARDLADALPSELERAFAGFNLEIGAEAA